MSKRTRNDASESDSRPAPSSAGAAGAMPAVSFKPEKIAIPPIPAIDGDYKSYAAHVKIISMFNNKGGVGKTTMTAMIGWALAAKGQRVVMFDMDPQRNLSQFYLRCRVARHGLDYGKYVDMLPKPHSIPQAIYNVWHVPIAPPKPVFSDLVANFDNGGELRLVLGDSSLQRFETALAVAENSVEANPINVDVPGAMYHALLLTAKAYKADYVLIDLSPNMGPVNRSLLCSSNYFIVPCANDYFSNEAIVSLATALIGPGTPVDWREYLVAAATRIRTKTDENHTTLPLPEPRPKFLGIFMTRFTTKKIDSEGGIKSLAAAVGTGVRRVLDTVRTTLVPRLRSLAPEYLGLPAAHGGGVAGAAVTATTDLVPSDVEFETAGVTDSEHRANYTLLFMRDFTSLNTLSQFLSVPVPFLTQTLGDRLESWCKQRAKTLQYLMEHDPHGAWVEGFEDDEDVGLTVDFKWMPHMTTNTQEFNGHMNSCINKILELAHVPAVVRQRSFANAMLAPAYIVPAGVHARVVDPVLTFTG